MAYMNRRFLVASLVGLIASPVLAQAWPQLPERNATVTLPAQEWPQKPGPRTIAIRIVWPQGKRAAVTKDTGIMLTLHNWGGEDCAGTASPEVLASRFDVVAICVNYLQSGRQASIDDPEPYDCGYLQALDALRALWFVYHGLQSDEQQFHTGRIYCTGGSGGGNVTLMATKLAPRTFACVIDLCGMKKLSHDIAFNLPGGSGLNARWSRSPDSPNYLSVDEQEIRYVAHPDHLRSMRDAGNQTTIVVVHGVDDTTCPFPDAIELVDNMRQVGLNVEPHFITSDDLDGTVFTSSGHALGNRTEIVSTTAGRYLAPGSPDLRMRNTPSDFDRRDVVYYSTTNGRFVISYADGYPVGAFEQAPTPRSDIDHQDVSICFDEQGGVRPIQTADDWNSRHANIITNMQQVMGPLPGLLSQVPLDVRVEDEYLNDGIRFRRVSFQSDPFDRVPAWLLLPEAAAVASLQKSTDSSASFPAVLCLHQTISIGKDEPVGRGGSSSMYYALELARRGYVTLAPDYPSLGEHQYDFADHPEYVSGTMKAIHDNRRAVDLLSSLHEVDIDRIGVIGHSLGGHSALFTAAFEPRLKVVVTSCGFTGFRYDDLPSWTGPRYMPRIATVYGNDARKVPFDFMEILASLAPRPCLVLAAEEDSDFDIAGVKQVIERASFVYRLLDSEEHLEAEYPAGPHDFSQPARERAWRFLDQHLKRGDGSGPQ